MKHTLLAAAVGATALLSACDGGVNPKPSLKTDADTLSYALGVAQSPSDEELKAYLMQAGSDSAYIDAFLKGIKDGLNTSDDKKELAYQMGMQTGMQMKTRMFPSIEQQVFASDSTRHLSVKHFLHGMLDGGNGQSALKVGNEPCTRETVQPLLNDLMSRMQATANEKVFGESRKKNEAFMEKTAKEAGVKALAGGVLYKETKAGTGATPKVTNVVEVEYEGSLIDGTVFDATKGQAAQIPLGQVVPGWQTALTNMKEGAEWTIYIPWKLGYGERGQGPIKPFSTLIFKVKLVKASVPQPEGAQPGVQMMPAR